MRQRKVCLGNSSYKSCSIYGMKVLGQVYIYMYIWVTALSGACRMSAVMSVCVMLRGL